MPKHLSEEARNSYLAEVLADSLNIDLSWRPGTVSISTAPVGSRRTVPEVLAVRRKYHHRCECYGSFVLLQNEDSVVIHVTHIYPNCSRRKHVG
jgi:hypothetical protein